MGPGLVLDGHNCSYIAIPSHDWSLLAINDQFLQGLASFVAIYLPTPARPRRAFTPNKTDGIIMVKKYVTNLPGTEICHKTAKIHSDKKSLLKYLVFTLVQNYATKQT